MSVWVCRHCAQAPDTQWANWLAHHACKSFDCACAQNEHKLPKNLAEQAHDAAIAMIRDLDKKTADTTDEEER